MLSSRRSCSSGTGAAGRCDRTGRLVSTHPSTPTEGVTVLWPGLGTVDLEADPGMVTRRRSGAVLRRVLRVGATPAGGRARHRVVVRRRRRLDRPVDRQTGAALVRGTAPPAGKNRPVRALSARSGGELIDGWLGNHPRRPVVEAASVDGGPVSESTTWRHPDYRPRPRPSAEAAAPSNVRGGPVTMRPRRRRRAVDEAPLPPPVVPPVAGPVPGRAPSGGRRKVRPCRCGCSPSSGS